MNQLTITVAVSLVSSQQQPFSSLEDILQLNQISWRKSFCHQYTLGKNNAFNTIPCEKCVQQTSRDMHTYPKFLPPVTGSQEEGISTFLLHFASSKSCREQWGDPSASFSPQLKKQVLSHSPRRHFFQPFHQICCRPLDAFNALKNMFSLWGPELHTTQVEVIWQWK